MAAYETKLPRAVREQKERTEQYFREINEPAAVDTAPVAATPAAASPDSAVPATPQGTSVPAAALENTPRAVATSDGFNLDTATADELREELKRSRARFLTLQGKYGAEVPRLHRDNRELREQLRRAQEAPPISNTPALSRAELKQLPPYLRVADELGEDVADAMLDFYTATPAQTRTPPPQAARAAEPPETQPTASQGPAESGSEAELAEYVNTMVGPDAFKSIDKLPEFQAWLDAFSHTDGSTRRAALIKAFKAGDIHRAAGYWIDWAEKNPAPKQTDPREALLDSSARSNDAPPVTDEQPITNGFIKQFYADVVKGKYKGRAAEKAEVEARINAATASGQVA